MISEAWFYLNRHLAIYRRLLMTASCCLSSLITIEGMSPALSQVVSLRLIARMNFWLKNFCCELFNLTGTVGKVELIATLAMFTLYRIGFCSVSKVAPIQCEQELIFLLRSRNCSEMFPVWTQALSAIQFATLPFDFKRSLTKTRFRCNFCSDESVQTWFVRFQKPIRYRTFHFLRSSTVPE